MFFTRYIHQNVFLTGWIIAEDGDDDMKRTTTMRGQGQGQGQDKKRWRKRMERLFFSCLNFICG
jgi:hypothetical protein